jgi:thymidylate kinase
MASGKLIIIEGIYGAGKLVAAVVENMRTALVSQGKEVYEIDSPDCGRAQLMGAQELDCGWRYGIFKPDFFFELASRARACSVIRQELAQGKVVICKNFTLSSIVYARLKGHDWFREDLNCLEARARGLQFNGEIVPDHTIFVDIPPKTAVHELGSRINGFFTPDDIELQQKYYHQELAKLPANSVSIIPAEGGAGEVAAKALSAIRTVVG